MKYAGFWIRALAFLIDFLIVNVAEFLVCQGISKAIGLTPFNEQILDTALSLLFYGYYYCFFQVKYQTTLGKKLFHLYPVDESTGAPITFKQADIRMFGYLASLIILGCGFLMAMFHPQKRTLHDLFAGTVVIKKETVNKGLS